MDLSRKSIVLCHKEVMGMKNFLNSVSTLLKPLIERQWFTVEKNVAQKQSKDLIPSSSASEKDINLQKVSDISIFPTSQREHSSDNFAVFVMVRVGTLFLSSVVYFVYVYKYL